MWHPSCIRIGSDKMENVNINFQRYETDKIFDCYFSLSYQKKDTFPPAKNLVKIVISCHVRETQNTCLHIPTVKPSPFSQSEAKHILRAMITINLIKVPNFHKLFAGALRCYVSVSSALMYNQAQNNYSGKFISSCCRQFHRAKRMKT